jgi:bifunctional DNase/RNase
MTHMVPVEIVGLRVDPTTGTSVVVLGESDGLTRVLPIIIGPVEAQSIADSLNDIAPLRPNAHDLAASLLVATGSRLDEVAVTELVAGVFFAELFVESALGMQSVSARPSDAISIAVRMGAPIFVRASVLDAAAIRLEHAPAAVMTDDQIDEVVSEFQALLETARPSDFAQVEHEAEQDEDVGWGDDD